MQQLRLVSVKCTYCDEEIEPPSVVLPCETVTNDAAKTICAKHLPGMYSTDDNAYIFCPICTTEHAVPTTGFPANEIAEQHLILNRLKLCLNKTLQEQDKLARRSSSLTNNHV